MNLPKPAFISIAEESKLCLVLNNRLYTVKPKVEESNSFFYILNNKYNLKESETLRFLEMIYFKNNQNELRPVFNDLTKTKLEESQLIKGDIDKLKREYELINFAIHKVFPLVNNRKKKKEITSTKKGLNEKTLKILGSKENSYNYKNAKDDFEYILDREYSILERNIVKKDILISNNNVYEIKKIPETVYQKIRDRFKINSSCYSYSFLRNLKDLENEYSKLLFNEITKAADYGSQKLIEITKLLKQKDDFLSIVNKKYYERGNIGFLKIKKGNHENFYVFIKEKPFALKSLNAEEHYKFEKCKLGVELKLGKNKIEVGYPKVIDMYSHPLLPKKNATEQRICYGDEKRKKEVNIELNEFDKKGKTAEKVYYLLKVIGEPALRSGYFGDLIPHLELNKKNFGDYLISLEELNRKRIPVTN